MFEKQKEQTGAEVDKMLDRLKERIDAGKIEKSAASKTIETVVAGIVKAKDVLNKDFNFDTASPKEIADLSNAWRAWGETGVFKGAVDPGLKGSLKGLLNETDSKVSAAMKKFARQMWRTEMVSYIIEKLKASNHHNKPGVMNAVMESQKVTEKEDEPFEALTIAMWLDPALREKSARQALAEKMASGHACGFTAIRDWISGYQPKEGGVKVVVGGEFLVVPSDLACEFMFKNMVSENGRIYGQMQNGCQGNLVIIELEEAKVAPPPEPQPPTPTPPEPEPGPGPVPPGPPPGPGPEPHPPEPHPPEPPKPPKSELPETQRGTNLIVSDRPGELVRTGEQFNEMLSGDVMSNELIAAYTTFGISPFLEGLDKIPQDKREAVLQIVFRHLNEKDPNKARALLQEMVETTRADLQDAVLEAFDEMILKSSGDEKKMWEVQKMLIESNIEEGDPEKLQKVFEKLDSINPNNLPPELKEMYETQRRYLEFFMKRSIAADLVDNATSVLDSTFTKHKDLKDWAKKYNSDAAIGRALRDEGLGEWLITDEEVYLASSHVLEAIRLALIYVYPEHMQKGYKIDNPVKYYYHWIKTGKLNQIKIPKGAPSVDFREPLGRNFVAGDTIDFNKLFIDRKREFEIFDEYQSGGESLGERSIWDMYEGSAGAFMGEDVDGRGLIEGSDEIFDARFFESGGNLGSVERSYLVKIKTAMSLKHYDEARALCVQILRQKLEQTRKIDPNGMEVTARADKLSEDGWMTKIRAQARIELANQGISSSADVKSKNIPRKAGGIYQTLDELITDAARSQLEERAYLELQGEVGEILNEQNPDMHNFTGFERAVFEQFKEINGYGAFDIREEKADVIADLSKLTAEIVAVSLVLGVAGGFMAGAAAGTAVTAAEGAAIGARAANLGSRGFNIARGTGLTGRAFAAGTRVGAASGRFGRAVFAPARYLSQGNVARQTLGGAVGTIGHATAFVELQSALHAEFVNPFSKQGAFYIGTMAVTLYGLNTVQKFMRGQGALARLGAQPLHGWRMMSPVHELGRTSALLGRLVTPGPGMGRLLARNFLIEYPVEVVALHNLGRLETELAVQADLITRTQEEAMYEPDPAKRYAHTAVTVAALRMMNVLRRPPEPPPEPRPPEPPPPGPTEPPPPLPPPTIPVRSFEPLPIKGHDVDIIAKTLSKNRYAGGIGIPKGEVKVGDEMISVEAVLDVEVNGKKLKTHYEDALKIEPEPERARRLEELDRLAAERLILGEVFSVEYPTENQARAALLGISREYPNFILTVHESGGKFYLFEVLPYKVETVSRMLREKAALSPTRIPSGNAGLDGVDVPLEKVLGLKVDGKTIEQLYIEANAMPDGIDKESALFKVNKYAAERLVLTRHGAIEYTDEASARETLAALTRDEPSVQFEVITKNGRHFVKRKS